MALATETYVASDGATLAYQRSTAKGHVPSVVLLHGWSGSRRSFDLNFDAIAKHCDTIAPDVRYHGDSDAPGPLASDDPAHRGGIVARFAKDLRELILHLGLHKPVVVGCSMGCAIIWSYVDQFGTDDLGGLIFVDQAPSQWMMPDWDQSRCSKGIFDEVSLASIEGALHAGLDAFADGNAECCLSRPLASNLVETLKAETQRCKPEQLAKIMADHARADWRDVLHKIRCPLLNFCGKLSGCFPVRGMLEINRLVPEQSCVLERHAVVWHECNHWLYMEEPARFNEEVVSFATTLAQDSKGGAYAEALGGRIGAFGHIFGLVGVENEES